MVEERTEMGIRGREDEPGGGEVEGGGKAD